MSMAKADRPLGVPTGWNDLIVRTLEMAVVAFLVLVLKEWMDTREWDVKACLGDSAWIAGGAFVFNAIVLGIVSKNRQ